MDLSYFYNAVNESDDMKMWFGTIDTKLESLMNDLNQSVLESTEENNKSYNSEEGKAYEKQMKKDNKTKGNPKIIDKALDLLLNVIRVVKNAFSKFKKFIRDKIDEVVYGKVNGNMNSAASDALVPADFDYKRGTLKMMEVLSPFINGMSNFFSDIMKINFHEAEKDAMFGKLSDSFKKILDYDPAEMISNKEYNSTTITEINAIIFNGFFGGKTERVNASELKASQIDVAADKNKILGCIQKIEDDIIKNLNKIRASNFKQYPNLYNFTSLIISKAAKAAKMITNICAMATKSYAKACAFQNVINKAYYKSPVEKEKERKEQEKEMERRRYEERKREREKNIKPDNVTKTLVAESNDLFEEVDLFEEEINSYSESLGYPSYEDYYIEALEESINNMVGLYYDEIVMEAEDGSDTKKEDTKSDKKEEDNGVETKEKGKNKVSFRNKSQMLIRKIQILLQKFSSILSKIIGQVNDIVSKALAGTILANAAPNIISARSKSSDKEEKEREYVKSFIYFKCGKIEQDLFNSIEGFVDNLEDAATKPISINSEPESPIDMVFKGKFTTISEYTDAIKKSVKNYSMQVSAGDLQQMNPNIFNLEKSKIDFEKGLKSIQSKINNILKRVTARARNSNSDVEYGYCVRMVTACSALMSITQRAANIMRGCFRETTVLYIWAQAYNTNKNKSYKSQWKDFKNNDDKKERDEFNKKEKEEREQREKDFKNKTGEYADKKEDAKKEDAKQESLQESFFEKQNKNRNVSRKVSNILSKLY